MCSCEDRPINDGRQRLIDIENNFDTARVRCGIEKVQAHRERLRTEAPRIYAALKPLLDDLDQWMRDVSVVLHRHDLRK